MNVKSNLIIEGAAACNVGSFALLTSHSLLLKNVLKLSHGIQMVKTSAIIYMINMTSLNGIDKKTITWPIVLCGCES